MPTILIVDDSSVDRHLVGGLLKKEKDLTLQYATNGAEALAQIEREPPDIVLTDLIMPQMDGLQLVEAVKERFPLLPVILMTSKGNEEIAVRALQRGAASYTPKKALATSLIDTLHTVLDVSTRKQSRVRLLGCMTERLSSFELDNDYSLIPPLVGLLQDDAVGIGLCDQTERVRLGVALDEALVNALYHGNLELSSELRDADHQRYAELVRQRRSTPPYCHRRIHVRAKLSPSEASFTIRDEGPGFDPAKLPDPTDPANLEDLGGRGVLLMRTFMDEVLFNDTGNEVTMIKRRSSRCDPSRNDGDG